MAAFLQHAWPDPKKPNSTANQSDLPSLAKSSRECRKTEKTVRRPKEKPQIIFYKPYLKYKKEICKPSSLSSPESGKISAGIKDLSVAIVR